ncbi:MAG TPA: DUF58 domain-containing protein [Candidatus Nanoarchaeia archaeon]|nr:DUF58 domain-containing protein [Candidatus Nanoarchaeia archaeon]
MPIKELRLDLLPKFKNVDVRARLDIINKFLEGDWTTMLKGPGTEFAGFRPYNVFVDDASLIDWKATLRAGEVLIREFEATRSFQVFILLDVSDSMLFSSTEKLKCEYAAELAFSLCFAIPRSGETIGLGMFTNKLVSTILPAAGKQNFYRILGTLTDPKKYGGPKDFKRALRLTDALLKNKSVVIIISDFLGLEPGWGKYIQVLTQKYDLVGVMIRDPRDCVLPESAGQFLVQDPFSEEELLIDTHQYAKAYKKLGEDHERKVQNVFEKSKASFLSLRTDKPFYDPLLKFFKKRKKMTV